MAYFFLHYFRVVHKADCVSISSGLFTQRIFPSKRAATRRIVRAQYARIGRVLGGQTAQKSEFVDFRAYKPPKTRPTRAHCAHTIRRAAAPQDLQDYNV